MSNQKNEVKKMKLDHSSKSRHNNRTKIPLIRKRIPYSTKKSKTHRFQNSNNKTNRTSKKA